ncbi:MAG: hypothetical protein A3A86_01890 [Elusimicrobia bacterium RIFCSPLOWO2_01_FULL_60_11]|nr:MAG: hypothetical protein A3A86_01890 [Elusimicrobia bacterium RIFCSPLOWO2_01_FULL_60_11]
MDITRGDFTWDLEKERKNIEKHGVNFETACEAFRDQSCQIIDNTGHSFHERRFYCIGQVEGRILTVRFTHREGRIRVIGAGFWRKGRKLYEAKQL